MSLRYKDGVSVLHLCEEFEKTSKKSFGEFKGKCGLEAHRKLVSKVRKIVEEEK